MDTSEEGRSITLPGWLDLKVSLGNILTIGTILAAGIISYAKMDGRVTSTEQNQAKAEMVYVRRDIAELREQALQGRLVELKDQLDRMEKKLDSFGK